MRECADLHDALSYILRHERASSVWAALLLSDFSSSTTTTTTII